MLFVELHQAQFVVRNCLVPPGFCGLYNKTSLLGLLTFDSAYYLIFVTERMGLFKLSDFAEKFPFISMLIYRGTRGQTGCVLILFHLEIIGDQ